MRGTVKTKAIPVKILFRDAKCGHRGWPSSKLPAHIQQMNMAGDGPSTRGRRSSTPQRHQRAALQSEPCATRNKTKFSAATLRLSLETACPGGERRQVARAHRGKEHDGLGQAGHGDGGVQHEAVRRGG